MKDDLLPYYERELGFLRQTAGEFAAKYPKIASRLKLEPNKCEDPHVERLIEAFALLAGRVHHKIDDEFPEITEALLGILYPHYLCPIPSMSIVQFEVDPEQAKLSDGYSIAKDSTLHSKSFKGTPCQFRTCYPVTLWPLEVTSASMLSAAGLPSGIVSGDAAAAIRIEMRCFGGTKLAQLQLDRLRFFLDGGSQVVHTLFELIFNNALRVILRDRTAGSRPAQIILPQSCLREVGFGKDEGMLPYGDRSFLGYRLLQEYFSFPQKFFFFDVCGLDRVSKAGFGEQFEFLILLSDFERKDRLVQLEQAVNSGTFCLGCTPIVNLFERSAEPIRLTQAKTEYRVVPDENNKLGTEVYAIKRVTSAGSYSQESQEYEPFYSLRHAFHGDETQTFWHATRRPSTKKGDAGTEVYLSLVDLNFSARLPPTETLTVHVTCTNRDLPGKLPFKTETGDFQLEAASMLRIRCLRAPTESVRPPTRRGLQWRLISHLALNYLSIVEGGREALQEILKLYDFSEDPAVRKQIAGVIGVSSRPQIARVTSENGIVFCQGIGAEIHFDEEQFVGSGVHLLASVLERFLGLYSSINSFSQLTVTTKQRKEPLRQWLPRAGEKILL